MGKAHSPYPMQSRPISELKEHICFQAVCKDEMENNTGKVGTHTYVLL